MLNSPCSMQRKLFATRLNVIVGRVLHHGGASRNLLVAQNHFLVGVSNAPPFQPSKMFVFPCRHRSAIGLSSQARLAEAVRIDTGSLFPPRLRTTYLKGIGSFNRLSLWSKFGICSVSFLRGRVACGRCDPQGAWVSEEDEAAVPLPQPAHG